MVLSDIPGYLVPVPEQPNLGIEDWQRNPGGVRMVPATMEMAMGSELILGPPVAGLHKVYSSNMAQSE